MVSATALVVPKQGAAFKITKVELNNLRPDELLVPLNATRICHTDLAVNKTRYRCHFPPCLVTKVSPSAISSQFLPRILIMAQVLALCVELGLMSRVVRSATMSFLPITIATLAEVVRVVERFTAHKCTRGILGPPAQTALPRSSPPPHLPYSKNYPQISLGNLLSAISPWFNHLHVSRSVKN
jgi:hypothetical protein